MNVLLLLFALGAAIHAWSYGRFIRRENRAGAIGIYFLAALTLLLVGFIAVK